MGKKTSNARRTKRTFDSDFKVRVVLEALSGEKRVTDIAAEYGIHVSMIHTWRKRVLDALPNILDKRGANRALKKSENIKWLYQKLTQIQFEHQWLQSLVLLLDADVRRKAVERGHLVIPLLRQAKLLGLPRSSLYKRGNQKRKPPTTAP